MPDAEVGTVLVTGGASGLGRAVADAVDKAGGTPVVLDIAEPAADVEWLTVDLADARGTEKAVAQVVEQHGGLDAVVTAAGIDACGDLANVPAIDWERVIAVNLVGTAAVVRAALPALIARQGRVVTVASTLGVRALPAATAYSASKFGVVGFTRPISRSTNPRTWPRPRCSPCASRAAARSVSC
jgi:NAD(P)-dependent dehydrogenase (short-subunit alcohol dehydrogenase family)